MEITTLTKPLINLFLDILPKAITKPSGKEKSRVRKNIPIVLNIPEESCCSITCKLISYVTPVFYKKFLLLNQLENAPQLINVNQSIINLLLE